MIPRNPYMNREPINFATLPMNAAILWAAMTHLQPEVQEWAQTLHHYDSLLGIAQRLIDQRHVAEHPRLFASFIAFAYQKALAAKVSS